MTSDVWSFNEAVDEVYRLRRVVRRLASRELALLTMLERWRARADDLERTRVYPPATVELRHCADQAQAQLLPSDAFAVGFGT